MKPRVYQVHLLNSNTFIKSCFSYSFDVMQYAYNADWKKVFKLQAIAKSIQNTIIDLKKKYFNSSTYNILQFSIIRTLG